MNRKTVLGGLTALALAAIGAGAPAASAAPCDGKDTEQPFLDWHDKAFYGLVEAGDFESSVENWTLVGAAAVTEGGNPLREQSSGHALSLPAESSATTPPVCVTKGNPVARIFGHTLEPGEGSGGLKVEVLYLDGAGEVRKTKPAGKLKNESSWDATRRFSLAQGLFGSRRNSRASLDGPTGPEPCEEDPATAKPCDRPDGSKPEDAGVPNPDRQGGPKPCETAAKPCGDAERRKSYIKLRFTPRRGSAWEIDDVFVDPRRRI